MDSRVPGMVHTGLVLPGSKPATDESATVQPLRIGEVVFHVVFLDERKSPSG